MQLDSTESTAGRRPADRSGRVLAAIALVAAGLALLPVAFHGQRRDAAVAAAPTASPVMIDSARSSSTKRGGTPSYFGFLEFDWEHGVPGFDPGLIEGSRP